MSQSHKEPIDCPHCHARGEFELWDSVNVDLDPELRDKIFNDELFLWQCSNCRNEVFIPFGTLYHDMRNKFMLFFSFKEPKEGKYDPLEILQALGIEDGYTIRSVYGLINFKEKIAILENGLNDVVIERMKYIISHISYPEISEKRYDLRFGGLNAKEEDSMHESIIFFYLDEEKEEKMILTLPMDNYYEHKLAVKLDPRFNVERGVCVDQEWIANQMKKSAP